MAAAAVQIAPEGMAYPTLAPGPPVGAGVGLPTAPTVLPWAMRPSDVGIRGGFKVNPAYAGDFFAGQYVVNDMRPGGQEPLEVKNKAATQKLATDNSPSRWKMGIPPRMADSVMFGDSGVQAPITVPWIKKFIPPLALFNDASQWVNRLMFHQPMVWYGAVEQQYPLKAQYFTPPPINTNNLAAGTLNLQLQLGNIAIQAQQLTMQASNYFGGS